MSNLEIKSREEKEQKRLEIIQKEDKKAKKKFWKVMILCMLSGVLIGGAIGVFKSVNFDFGNTELLYKAGVYVSILGGFLTTTILLAMVYSRYSEVKDVYAAWDGEDEEIAEQMDLKLTSAAFWTKLIMIESYFFFSLGCFTTKLSGSIELLIVVALFVYALGAAMMLDQRVTNQVKMLNPEKKGSVYDFNFSKTWAESCDEAELYEEYKAAFQSRMIMNKVYSFVWLICMLWMMATESGMIAIAAVLLLWLLHTVTFQLQYKTKKRSRRFDVKKEKGKMGKED